MVQSPSWEANWFAANQEIPRILWNTSVRHLSLSWASPIQTIYPHPISWRSILVLSTHLRLGLPSGLLPSGFPTKTLYTPISSPIHATCPAHLTLLDFITRTILGEEYRSFSSSLCNLLHSPVPSSLLDQNILNTIFSNTLNFLSSLNVSDHLVYNSALFLAHFCSFLLHVANLNCICLTARQLALFEFLEHFPSVYLPELKWKGNYYMEENLSKAACLPSPPHSLWFNSTTLKRLRFTIVRASNLTYVWMVK